MLCVCYLLCMQTAFTVDASSHNEVKGQLSITFCLTHCVGFSVELTIPGSGNVS